MQIEESQKNVRCDSANCHNFATFNINTNGYKQNIYICEECFQKLFDSIQKIKKIQKKSK